MKYDAQLTELKNLLPNSKNILIALPVGADIDKFASGLALFLSLNQAGKEVTIVSDDTIRVGQSHLFGIDHVQKNLPQGGGGNLTLSLEGVEIAPDGTVPALQNLDWHPSDGNKLNLVFHVTPGQTFHPTQILPHYQGGNFNLIFAIGVPNLNALGGVYTQNQQAFSGIHIVNVDNSQTNTSFGQTNVVDSASPTVSEMVSDLITSLGLPLDQDIASNLLIGIFDATANLTDQRVNADTFMAVAGALRVGGKKPVSGITPSQPINTNPTQPPASLDLSFLMLPTPAAQPTTLNTPQPSAEERPAQEAVTSADTIEAEPGWLTPKVFKGTSAG